MSIGHQERLPRLDYDNVALLKLCAMLPVEQYINRYFYYLHSLRLCSYPVLEKHDSRLNHELSRVKFLEHLSKKVILILHISHYHT